MEKYEDLLKEFEALLGKDDERSERRKDEIVAWMEANGDEGAKRACEEMIMRNLGLHCRALLRQEQGVALPTHQRPQGARQGIHAERGAKTNVQRSLPRLGQGNRLVQAGMTFLHCLFILSHPARSMSLPRAFSCLATHVGQGLVGWFV